MKDIKLNEKLTDLDIGMEVVDAGEQTMAMLSYTAPGEWKASPQDGLEVARYASAPMMSMLALRNRAQEAMERNGIEGSARVERGRLIIEIK